MLRWVVILHLILGHIFVSGLIPKPVSIEYTKEYYRIPLNIDVQHNAPYCFVLHGAIKRALVDLRRMQPVIYNPDPIKGNVTLMMINITSPCDELHKSVFPVEGSNEACTF